MKFSCSHGTILFWVCMLAFCTNWTVKAADPPDLCDDDDDDGDGESIVETYHLGIKKRQEKQLVEQTCFIYPNKIWNCSMPSGIFQVNSQVSAFVTICYGEDMRPSTRKCSSVDNVASERSLQSGPVILCQDIVDNNMSPASSLFLHVNVSWPDTWKMYSVKHAAVSIEVLSPPPDIEATVNEEGYLDVKWGVPHSHFTNKNKCFEYQLSISGQDRLINVAEVLTYRDMKAEPTQTYNVMIRTRRLYHCQGLSHWSDWSPVIKVDAKESKFSIPVIICIAVVLPMILLALVILFRLRVTVLYPPIPQPPMNYKHFMEKMEDIHFSPPVLSHAEEITVVEEPDQCSEKTIKQRY